MEQIATPLTAEDAEQPQDEDAKPAPQARPRRRREPGRYRPGPGQVRTSPGMWASIPTPDVPLDREIAAIVHTLGDQHAPLERQALARLVGARYWGPGRFRRALGSALLQGRIERVGRDRFAAR